MRKRLSAYCTSALQVYIIRPGMAIRCVRRTTTNGINAQNVKQFRRMSMLFSQRGLRAWQPKYRSFISYPFAIHAPCNIIWISSYIILPTHPNTTRYNYINVQESNENSLRKAHTIIDKLEHERLITADVHYSFELVRSADRTWSPSRRDCSSPCANRRASVPAQDFHEEMEKISFESIGL